MPEQTFLYRAFCEHGGLLYVGITDNYERRLRQHAFGSEWWPSTDRITVVRYRTRWSARRAERYVIEHDNPVHNLAGAPLVPSPAEVHAVIDPVLPGVIVLNGPTWRRGA